MFLSWREWATERSALTNDRPLLGCPQLIVAYSVFPLAFGSGAPEYCLGRDQAFLEAHYNPALPARWGIEARNLHR